jgi:hypothetical protein
VPAALEAIAKAATILDYPEKEGGEMAVLRQGGNVDLLAG